MGFFLSLVLCSFPNAWADAATVQLIHIFLTGVLKRRNTLRAREFEKGDVRCVSGPLVGNAVDSHEVSGVISLANSVGITAILRRPARSYTTKYCAQHCPLFCRRQTRLSLVHKVRPSPRKKDLWEGRRCAHSFGKTEDEAKVLAHQIADHVSEHTSMLVCKIIGSLV